jgi:hypothetical protein
MTFGMEIAMPKSFSVLSWGRDVGLPQNRTLFEDITIAGQI